VLLIQSIPYLAAVIMSFIAAIAHVPNRLIADITQPLTDDASKKLDGQAYAPLQRQTTGKF
jgi:hypothetical protein